jgi:beta-fructofuranosidase
VNQPIAIYPGNKSEGVFSGSAVVDSNNTSGFFPNQKNGVVAIYTLNQPNDQSQNLAISYDSGYTFKKYEGNPVLSIGSTQFRDPKVIWYAPTQKWVLVLAYAQEFTVGIFTSDNLVNWTAASNFSYHGLLGFQWECPNMVEMPVENSTETLWVMAVSINPGAPLGGSITQYAPGHFNGTHFTAVDSTARIADFGKDNYAGQYFYGIPAHEPQISIAWASNWQYSQTVPTGPLEGWRSSMSLPRRNYLKNTTRVGYRLVSTPYDITPLVTKDPLESNSNLGNGTILVDFSTLASQTIYFELNITNVPAVNTTGTANFTFLSSVSGESLSGGQYLSGDNPFWLNRGLIRGFDNPFFTDKFSTNVLYDPNTAAFTIAGLLDRSVFEVFLQGGEQSATITLFPDQPLDVLVIRTGMLNQGVTASVKVWGLDSAWKEYEDEKGTVVGNVTSGGMMNSTGRTVKRERDVVMAGRSRRLY